MSSPRWTRNALSLSLKPLIAVLSVLISIAGASYPALSQTTTGTTNFAIGTTVQQSSVKRLGINLSNQSYWDSGQMLRNLTFRNPGFEGNTWNTVIQCAAATTTSCTDSDQWTSWTANFWQGATIEVVSGAGNGETTTVTGNTISDFAAGNTSNPTYGATLSFTAMSTPIAANDWIIVRTTIPGNAQSGWWTSTSGGATISTDLTDIASDSPGKQAVELSASGSGQSATINGAWDTTVGRSFLQMNGTYTIQFKAKGLGGNNVLNVNAVRLATSQGNEEFFNQNITLTNAWQDYSYTFTANENGSMIGPAQLAFTVSGASVYLDDVALTEAAAANNPTAYRNAVVERLEALKPGVIRYMDETDFGTSIANAVAVPFAREPAGYNGTPPATDDPMGLEEFLVLCQTVGAEPWYTMAGTSSVTDMQNLIEFLGGSASTPFGAIRASLGQSEPWTSVFPKIHIELGNEMWNGVFQGEALYDPAVYGARAGLLFTAAKESASYSPNIDLIMGSQEVNPGYTTAEMATASNYDSFDAAPYLFYTLSDYSSNEDIFGPMFAQPEQIDEATSPDGNYMAQQAAVAASGPTPVNLEVYEVNLSTDAGSAPQNVVNEVVGGVGAGIAVADHMLLMLRDLGITTQNMFALEGWENGFSGTTSSAATSMPLWGSVVDMGGETNLNRPTYLAEQMVNNAIYPTMLATTVTGANPTWDQALSANDTVTPIELPTAHYLQSFAFTDGTNYSTIVINLSRSTALPITFSGANAPTGNVLVTQLTSANPTDNNEGLTTDTPVVSPTTTDISSFNPSTPYSLPPFSLTVFSWPGSSLPQTTTTLIADPTSATLGESVTLTATVASQSSSNTPTGTVTFMNGSTSLGTGAVNSSGVATLATTALPAGSDSITASYGGDSNNAGSTSTAVVVAISGSSVATTTSLAASSTAISTGQSVTFTATVAPTSGTTVPTGTVTFLNGTTTLGTGTLNASGAATFSTAALPAGADPITASYAGTTTDSSSVSSAVTVNVTQTVTATQTALVASATNINPGQSVTFTATVSPVTGSTAPTGTVTFLNGTATVGTAAVGTNGTASFTTTALASGTDSITASYGGSAANSASVSAAVKVTVAPVSVTTTTSLTASASSISTGQSVTFTAKVAAQSGTNTPTGEVAFMNGSTILGTETVSSGGVATFSTTALPAGTDQITASYEGSTSFGSSVSSAVTVTVTQSQTATTTKLAASASQITAGESITFTATVTASSGTATPTGTVTFTSGGTTIGTAALSAGGTATFTTAALTAGTDLVTAAYGGATAFADSTSNPLTITVEPSTVATATSLTGSASAINTGQTVTFTATVTPQSGTTKPTGSVSFSDGSVLIGSAPLNGSGVATFTTSALPAGTDSITASYKGTTAFTSSTSSAVVVTVTQTVAQTTTALTASATQVDVGQSVVLTAVVSAQSGSTPTGTVTFTNGTTTLGTAAVGAGGSAYFSTSSLAAGSYLITASYGGSTTDSKSSSSAVSLTIVQPILATKTQLTSSDTSIGQGQGVTFTATVTPQSGSVAATGTVSFLDGSTIIGTETLNASGIAYFGTTSLSVGTHSITASYSGSTGDSSSISSPVTIDVIQSPNLPQSETGTALTASTTSIVSGQSVTLTAGVVSLGGPAPTGSVTFLNSGQILGTVALNNGSAVFTTSSLPVGTDSVSAVYGGNSSNLTSTSVAIGIVVASPTVNSPTVPTSPTTPTTPTSPTSPTTPTSPTSPTTPATPAPVTPTATTTTLTPSATQLNTGTTLTLNATVAGSGSTPTGTVTFASGQTTLGTGTLSKGTASFSTSSLAVGAYSITASYSGSTTNAASNSSPVTVMVAAATTPSYTMSVSSSSVAVSRGEIANLTVTVTPQNGFKTPINLSCSGLPAGTTCTFTPATVTPTGAPVSSTLGLSVASSTSTTSTTAENRGPHDARSRLALGLVMPWGLFSFLGLSRRKKRSRLVTWSTRLAIGAALIMGSLWMSGCGFTGNSSAFTMTVTSSGNNVATQTSQITVEVAP